MTTFGGRYIKEPRDFSTVASEAKLIMAFCDGRQVNARTFADLEPDDLAVIQRVADPLIAEGEGELDSYAAIGGYGIPLDPVDAVAIGLVAQWAWIGALQRGDTLTIIDAEKSRQSLRDGKLTDIAEGRCLLPASPAVAPPAQGSHVFVISDAVSRSTTGKTERVTRESLGRF